MPLTDYLRSLGENFFLIKYIHFSYFILVTGASPLHNFQEVGIISFPAHILVRRLIPPPQVLLHSPQSPACHLYCEGQGFLLQSSHANRGSSDPDSRFFNTLVQRRAYCHCFIQLKLIKVLSLGGLSGFFEIYVIFSLAFYRKMR